MGTPTPEQKLQDCSKMSCSSIDLMTPRDPLPVAMHLLANPGDSLLLQHTLDRLLEWVCPGLRLFHVSERACPVREYTRAHVCPSTSYPSLAVIFFLHESYGEERILRVLDFLQRPPWQYHHTENGHASSDAMLRPYLLPGRDFYSLGPGMPVWAVRPVHCGGEVLRVTLHSGHENFEDAVRLYETVLHMRAEEQKAGFCWFTLLKERTFSVQLALKQLAPGVRVETCHSAVLQFRVGEIGQLVPLLPNQCSPISVTRWQTEDLDGSKILFQVKGVTQPQRLLTSAFPLSCPTLPNRLLLRCPVPISASPGTRLCQLKERPLGSTAGTHRLAGGATESFGSSSACSTTPGSSCYSSQCSSPALLSINLFEPVTPSTSSVAHFMPQEEEEKEPETNVDTGCAVIVQRPALDTLARDLRHCLPEVQRTWGGSEGDSLSDPLPAQSLIQEQEPVDEFFI
ncbi:protein FAM124B isoform X4 [Silurus meridionalis]|uniref:protein FAM124B isoform X4 n=1 Tax=Silurus meridionalis TaxID=175797 RepID=UPI001EEB915F|nr:protein FAM124B isoform X4 [Silurus meridionalis]